MYIDNYAYTRYIHVMKTSQNYSTGKFSWLALKRATGQLNNALHGQGQWAIRYLHGATWWGNGQFDHAMVILCLGQWPMRCYAWGNGLLCMGQWSTIVLMVLMGAMVNSTNCLRIPDSLMHETVVNLTVLHLHHACSFSIFGNFLCTITLSPRIHASRTFLTKICRYFK
jgi:hypothetical protein